MRTDEFIKKYKVSVDVARRVNFGPAPRLVKAFPIYDIQNKSDALVREMEALLKANPTYSKSYWQDQGPCSNWGWNVWRPETEDEFETRIQKEIKLAKKHLQIKKKALDECPIKTGRLLSVEKDQNGRIKQNNPVSVKDVLEKELQKNSV